MSDLGYMDKLLDGVEVEWRALGDICNVKNGYTPSKSKSEFWTNGTIPWFRMEDIRKNGRVLDNSIQHVTPSAVKSGKLFPANSIIISTTATIGEHAVITKAFLCNQQLTVLSIKENAKKLIDYKFLFYYGFILGDLCRKNVNPGGFALIGTTKIKSFEIPIPPLKIQAEIVRILDAFTELTSELTSELISRKRQYTYYRDQLLTFNDNEIEWKLLGDCAENLDSKRKPITSGLREPGDIPYYGASGIVDYVKDYIFDGDYLLVSEDGANLTARNTPIAFSISGKNWVNNHAHVLKFETYAERRYIEYYLNSIDLTPYISGAAQPKLNQKNLNSIKIPSPSLKEKERIVAILDKFDALTTSLTEGLPREIKLRQQQYEYYRELLLSFPKLEGEA